MTEYKIQIGTTELGYTLSESELVLGAVLTIHTAELDNPGTTRTQICIPDNQNFVETLGLSRYTSLESDAQAVVDADEE